MPINQMSYSTYSFSEINFVMAHPDLGQIIFTGESVGNIVIARAQDASVHEVAHDGSVMTSKVVTLNGTMNFTLHQSSAAHRWLIKALNAVMDAFAIPAWAEFTAKLESNTTGEVIDMSNISIQKQPDHNYQQNGQNVTWNFLVGRMTTTITL